MLALQMIWNNILKGKIGSELLARLASALQGAGFDIVLKIGNPISGNGQKAGGITDIKNGPNGQSVEIRIRPGALDVMTHAVVHEFMHVVEAMVLEIVNSRHDLPIDVADNQGALNEVAGDLMEMGSHGFSRADIESQIHEAGTIANRETAYLLEE